MRLSIGRNKVSSSFLPADPTAPAGGIEKTSVKGRGPKPQTRERGRTAAGTIGRKRKPSRRRRRREPAPASGVQLLSTALQRASNRWHRKSKATKGPVAERVCGLLRMLRRACRIDPKTPSTMPIKPEHSPRHRALRIAFVRSRSAAPESRAPPTKQRQSTGQSQKKSRNVH